MLAEQRIYSEIGRHYPNLIWRYMPFPQFVDVFENKRLWFPSVRLLHEMDPYEGFPDFKYFEMAAREAAARRLSDARHELTPDDIDFEVSNARRKYQEFCRSVYVSCWYSNEHEAYSMWKAYGGQDLPVAILAHPASVVAALPESYAAALEANQQFPMYNATEARLGPINYEPVSEMPDLRLDFRRDESWLFDSVFRKRPEFKGENEFRFALRINSQHWFPRSTTGKELAGVSPPAGFKPEQFNYDRRAHLRSISDGTPSFVADRSPKGVYLDFDPVCSVQKVIVDPSAAFWQLEVIRSIVSRSSLAPEDVEISRLAARPDVFSVSDAVFAEISKSSGDKDTVGE